MQVIHDPDGPRRPSPSPAKPASPPAGYPAVVLTIAVFVFTGWQMTHGFAPAEALLITAGGVAVTGGPAWLPRNIRKALRCEGRHL